MTDFHNRLTRLRAELVRQGLDSFVLATGDEHLSESGRIRKFPGQRATAPWTVGTTAEGGGESGIAGTVLVPGPSGPTRQSARRPKLLPAILSNPLVCLFVGSNP